LRPVGQQEEAVGQIGDIHIACLPRPVRQLQQKVGRAADGRVMRFQPQQRFRRVAAVLPVEAGGLGGRRLRLPGEEEKAGRPAAPPPRARLSPGPAAT